MSMRSSIRDIYKTFINDETLLRLLYYKPKNMADGTPDPLDSSNPNILDMGASELWAIIDERILLTPKTDDMDDKSICRLLFYAGRRRPSNSSFYLADQEIICDIICHFDYEKDQRSTWIADRINELLVGEHVTGIGKIRFMDGRQIGGSPKEYVGYRLTYEFGSAKK